ncbi:MAG: hypothetical protein J3T61_00810 [Candidatus Brocadiales bacterium]|nr:hypothetical protein [Candidatus Bathyanammoxibius sp.]
MSYKRHVDSVIETSSSIHFSLVVRDAEKDEYTYGGGWLTLNNPVADPLLKQFIDDAVLNIVENGDEGHGYPKKQPNIQRNDIVASSRPGQTSDSLSRSARLIKEHARMKNLNDRRRP